MLQSGLFLKDASFENNSAVSLNFKSGNGIVVILDAVIRCIVKKVIQVSSSSLISPKEGIWEQKGNF